MSHRTVAKIHTVISHPSATARQHCLPSFKAVGTVKEVDSGMLRRYVAVTVYMYATACIAHSYASQCRSHLTYCAVVIESQSVNTYRAIFVKIGRIVVVMIEKVPLAAPLHYGVVIGPTAVGPLVHNQAFKLKRAKRRIAHSVSQCLGFVLYPWKCEIILAVALEYEWPLLKTFGQSFEKYRLGSQCHHVIGKTCTAQPHTGPVYVACSVVIDKYARVNAINAVYRLRHGHERSFRTARYGHTYFKTTLSSLRCSGKIKIISVALTHTFGRPHRIRTGIYPRYTLLTDNNTMVGPVT